MTAQTAASQSDASNRLYALKLRLDLITRQLAGLAEQVALATDDLRHARDEVDR
jgi:hypothetical protein